MIVENEWQRRMTWNDANGIQDEVMSVDEGKAGMLDERKAAQVVVTPYI